MKRAMAFARRNARELVRDPLTVGFSLGFPLVLLALLTQVWSRMYSNWLFVDVDLQRFNVWLECGTFLVPLVIFCSTAHRTAS